MLMEGFQIYILIYINIYGAALGGNAVKETVIGGNLSGLPLDLI